MRHECAVRAEDLGPYLLGQLDPGEAAEVADAVRECPLCAAEVAELRPVVHALSRAQPGDHEPVRAPAPALDRVLAAVHRPARRQRVLLGAAAAVVVAAVLSAVLLVRGAGPDPAQHVALTGRPGTSGVMSVSREPWGTAIELDVRGLTPGATYGAWLADRAGKRVGAGTFRPGSGGTVQLALSSGLPLDQAGAVGVTEIGGADVLRGAVS